MFMLKADGVAEFVQDGATLGRGEASLAVHLVIEVCEVQCRLVSAYEVGVGADI